MTSSNEDGTIDCCGPAPATRVLSIVVPVYGNEESLPQLLEQLAAIDFGVSIECNVVFVIDGSPDSSADLLRKRLDSFELPATLVLLSRNFGSFAAIRAGLEEAEGDYFAVVAADLQEPPELLVSFVERLETQEVDLVLGERRRTQRPAHDARDRNRLLVALPQVGTTKHAEGGS